MAESIGTPVLWGGFSLLVLALLAIDLGVFHRDARAVRAREALGWSIAWVALALAFNLVVWWRFGEERGLEFLTGYLIERALSFDNLFVFLVIFSYFAVPAAYQHRVLFWGIGGAVIFRVIFILAGAALLAAFHWVIYVFGGLLIVTGVKMLRSREQSIHPEHNPVIRGLRRIMPIAPDYDSQRFFTRVDGRLMATPLLLTLATVEATDIIFAVDSIPAIFAVTTDPFIVFTSNIFAILGLRATYFLLAGVVGRFRYLQLGLGLVLVFVGIKMAGSEFFEIPIGISLAAVALLIGGAIVASLRPPRPPQVPKSPPP